jgi:hypothetical protein
MRFKDKTPFYSTRLEEERLKDKRIVMTVSLNDQETQDLRLDMRVLRQPKDSTALKQLWKIGRSVLHDQKMGAALRTVLGNVERNDRTGALLPEPGSDANVTQKNG